MSNKPKSLKKNAMLNVIKQICTIIFPMITFPYASRVLGTYNYGKINFGASIITYLSLFAALGIGNYGIREGAKIKEHKEKLGKLCNELFSINLIFTALSYIILIFLIMFWKKLDGYSTLLWVQSLSIIFTTIGTDWINMIHEDYAYITIRYIICSAASVVLMFLIVHNRNDYVLYAFSSIFSTILANIMNVGYIRKTYDLHPRFTFKIPFKKHMEPILMLFGSTVAIMIYVNSDITILGIIKDENEVGLYSVSSKIYTMVKQVLNAMLDVAIPRIAYELATQKRDVVNQHLTEILNNLFIIVFPSAVGLLMLSKNIVLLISGKPFLPAYSSLQILSLALCFATASCFFINVVMIPYNMERKMFFATIVSAIVNILLNIVLIPYFGQNAAAFTTLLSEVIMTVMGIWFTRHVITLHSLRSLCIGIGGGILTFIICKAILTVSFNNVLQIVACMVCTGIVYLVYLAIVDRNTYRSIVSIIKNKLR